MSHHCWSSLALTVSPRTRQWFLQAELHPAKGDQALLCRAVSTWQDRGGAVCRNYLGHRSELNICGSGNPEFDWTWKWHGEGLKEETQFLFLSLIHCIDNEQDTLALSTEVSVAMTFLALIPSARSHRLHQQWERGSKGSISAISVLMLFSFHLI